MAAGDVERARSLRSDARIRNICVRYLNLLNSLHCEEEDAFFPASVAKRVRLHFADRTGLLQGDARL